MKIVKQIEMSGKLTEKYGLDLEVDFDNGKIFLMTEDEGILGELLGKIEKAKMGDHFDLDTIEMDEETEYVLTLEDCVVEFLI